MTTLRSFKQDQRVVVKQTEDGIQLNAEGTVTRVCTDGAAWVELDERSKVEGAHPFGADTDRAKKLKVYPEHCELPKSNSKERRTAERAKNIPPPPKLETFGKDHWSTFGYIETRCVDHKGIVDDRNLRCDKKRHPFHAHYEFGGEYSTRLKGGVLLQDHDDWDCIDDLISEGLLENIGSAINPLFKLTAEGRRCASKLREHKANGGNFAGFIWEHDS